MSSLSKGEKTVVLTNLKGAKIKTVGETEIIKKEKATQIELFGDGSSVVIQPKSESGGGSFEVTHWTEWKKSDTK